LIYIFFGFLFLQNKKYFYTTITIGLTMFFIFIYIQSKLSLQVVEIKNVLLLLPELTYAFLYFIRINITRYFFIKESFLSVPFQYFLLITMISFILYHLKNYKENRREVLLIIAVFIFSSISIPIARNNIVNESMPYYYSVLSFIPFALLFSIITHKFLLKLNMAIIAIAMFLLYYSIDQRMLFIFSERHTKNKIALMSSIQNHYIYEPFDDPAIKMVEEYKSINFVEIYNYWTKK